MGALERDGARGMTANGAVREPLLWLVRVLLAVALILVGVWTVQRTTWYLAIDQFGYLTFARDLAHGRTQHEWGLLPALNSILPRDLDVDVFAQTYIRRGGALFCRYSPGFPLVLALARILFGPTAEHLVNPLLLVLLLACLFAIGRRVFTSAWLGLATALLVALLPNYVLLWSTSPLRDVPAHLFALGGLLLLLPGGRRLGPGWHEAVAGLLLGCAITTRVDAILYLLPAASIALLTRTSLARRLAMGTCGLAIGVAPLLAYNFVSTGNPFRPTQGMEMNSVLSRAPTPSTSDWWRRLSPLPDSARAADDRPVPTPLGTAGAAASAAMPRPTPFRVQGGGLRFSHLAQVLPANLTILRDMFGDLEIALALVGALAALRTPALFLLVVPYCFTAMLFFSMWTLPGARYLTGVVLLLPLLVLQGACTVAALPAALNSRGHRLGGIAVALLLTLLLVAFVRHAPVGVPSALPWVNVVLASGVALAAVAGAWRPTLRPALVVALAVGLGLSFTLIWRSTLVLGTRASFQQAQVARARATVDLALEKPAVVLTTTQIGRPAENINYYTSAAAFYLEEMDRWGTAPKYAIKRLLRLGFSVYLLLTPERAHEWLSDVNIAPWYTGDIVRVVPPEQAIDYFVASPYHHGLPLMLVRLRLKPQGS